MARSLKSFVEEVATSWDEDTRKLHEEAGRYFELQVEQGLRLGSQLAALREESRLTQKALENLTGVQQSEISKIERGIANPTRDTLIKLGAALHQKLVFVPDEVGIGPVH